MKRNTIYILKLAELFENKVLKTFAKTDVHHTFYHKLSSFLDKPIDSDNLDKWIQKNSHMSGIFEALSLSGVASKNYMEFFLGNSKWARIYREPISDNELFDVEKPFILNGEGNIPNLWLYIGRIVYPSEQSKLSVDLSHNEFLYTALKEIFSSELLLPNNNFLQKVQLFYNQNKNKINELRQSFDGQPKRLGAGADGVAFAISSTLVLKIFKDPIAYKHAVQAKRRLHENPETAKTEAMIYDVGELGVFSKTPIYYYIIEKMKPVKSLDPEVKTNLQFLVTKIVKIIEDEKKDKWKKYKGLIKDKTKSSTIMSEIKSFSEDLAASLKKNDGLKIEVIEYLLPQRLNENWLSHLIEEILMKYLTGRYDLHMGNIGLTNYGVFKYFDPAFKDTNRSEINTWMYKG